MLDSVPPVLPVTAWTRAADDVAHELQTDGAVGLSSGEASLRLGRSGPNLLDAGPAVPSWRKLLAQFTDPLVLLLLAAMVVSLLAWAVEGNGGVPFEATAIGAVVLANAALGYLQRAKAERAVAALERMAAPTAAVVRDGVDTEIAAAELVPGDVLLLAEGDAVSADARLIEAASLSVSEASLTGESEAAVKQQATLSGAVAIGDRSNMVFSGTEVVRGRGRAIVTSTGMATEVGRIAQLLSTATEDPTPLQREILRVGRTLARAVVVIAAVVVAAILLTSDDQEPVDVLHALIVGVSLAVAAVPEGLPAVLSLVLSLGVLRMARHRAIVKDLSSVETLGSASVICSDKTGTLTRNEMTIVRIVTASGDVAVTGSGYSPTGGLLHGGERLGDGTLLNEAQLVVTGGCLANDASLREDDEGRWVVRGDPTEVAFLVAEHKTGTFGERDARYTRVSEQPFTSERMRMSTIHTDAAHDGQLMVVVKGAPGLLIERCSHEQVGEQPQPMDEARRADILEVVDQLADGALRTLAVAYRPLQSTVVPGPGEDLEHDLIYAGVVGIVDPPRDEVRTAIGETQRAGIRVVMITGDHPRTAARIAEQLGIADPASRTLAGDDIAALDDDALREAVGTVSVFARVAPEDKLRIVDALRASGHVVAMTGDGVNDAPALRRADIGIAMGVTGTDVAKASANMILADDDFATIVTAVREGRGIFANIRKFLRYLLSSNAGEVLTMLLGVLFAGFIGLRSDDAVVVPLLATQILWINLLTDAAPALAMGVDRPVEDLMDRPPRRLNDRVIDKEMQVGVLIVGLVMAVVTLLTLDLGLPGGLIEGSDSLVEARTMAFTTLVVAQLFNCFNARSERVSAFHQLLTNPKLWGAIALSLGLQVAVVYTPILNRGFGTTPLEPTDWLVCLGMASMVLWSVELRKLVARRMAPRGLS